MTLELHLPKGAYILAKVPSNSHGHKVFSEITHTYLYFFIHSLLAKEESGRIILGEPKEEYELIGPVSSITEEQAKDIMPSKRIKESWNDVLSTVYEDYVKDQLPRLYFKEALFSFHSWLKANKIYSENPYGDKCPHILIAGGLTSINELGGKGPQGNYHEIQRWQEAQERTSQSWILLKEVEQS